MAPEIVPREDWKPRPSPRPMDLMIKPVHAVYWTNSEFKTCKTKEKCLREIRDLQLYHLKGGMFDIPFNFLIGGDGRIYEGRGWDWGSLVPYTQQDIINEFRHPNLDHSIIIAHLGKEIETDPEHPMYKATMELINHGIEINEIKPEYETIVQKYWVHYGPRSYKSFGPIAGAQGSSRLEVMSVYGINPSEEREPFMVERGEWGALPPTDPNIPPLRTPVDWVIMTYAKMVPRCNDPDICEGYAKQIQKYHMDRGASDIPYNFLIGLDWRSYVGRGWTHTCPLPKELQHLDGRVLVLAYIGPKSDKRDPTLNDHIPAYRLVNWGIDNQLINEEEMEYRHYPDDWNTYEKAT